MPNLFKHYHGEAFSEKLNEQSGMKFQICHGVGDSRRNMVSDTAALTTRHTEPVLILVVVEYGLGPRDLI